MTKRYNIDLLDMLLLLFIALKLTGVIAWSWWWVLSPLWIPWAVMFAITAVTLIAVGIGCAIVAWRER